MNSDSPLVFVVDDDHRVREALSSLISSVGLQVAVFGSAAEFLEFERPEAPGCLVLDLQLPGTSGLELQQQLLAGDTPPIVFISGHGDIPSSVRAIKAGAIEFLPKPFDDQELLRAIHAAIDQDRIARRKEIGTGRIAEGVTSFSLRANGRFFPSWWRVSPTNRLAPIWEPARSRSGFTGARSCEKWPLNRSQTLSEWPTNSESPEPLDQSK